MDIVIIGAGGHGKVVADALKLAGSAAVGFVDDNPTLKGQSIASLRVLGSLEILLQNSACQGAFGIGDNTVRYTMVQKFAPQAQWKNAIHPSAVLSDSSQVGMGVSILARAVINPYATIGNFCIINTGVIVEHDCTVEDFAHIAPGVVLAGNVHVGSGTLIGIGANIIPGCSVGAWSIIGAGTVVTQNLPSNCVAVGVPARIIKTLEPGWHLKKTD